MTDKYRYPMDHDGSLREGLAQEELWRRVHSYARQLRWAYLATVNGTRPSVVAVHPAWESRKLWIATVPSSPKVKHIAANPNVSLLYQVGPEFIHLTVAGSARLVTDRAECRRVWDLGIFDYDLAQFWTDGPNSADFGLLLVSPVIVRLIPMAAENSGVKPAVWRASS